MKFGKLDKRKMVTLKKLDDDVMSANCDVTVVFPIYSQFGAIRILAEAWSVKLKFSLTVIFYLTKPESRTNKSLTQLSYYCFE